MAKQTYNPCDDCKYNFSYNNQECPMCKICEFKWLLDKYTADVVPKSEVGALEREVRLLTENTITAKYSHCVIGSYYAVLTKSLEDYEKVIADISRAAKAEVAREIFAEIAEKLEGLFDFFRQDGCIRESSAIMLAISEIAELKKKYTEGESNG